MSGTAGVCGAVELYAEGLDGSVKGAEVGHGEACIVGQVDDGAALDDAVGYGEFEDTAGDGYLEFRAGSLEGYRDGGHTLGVHGGARR